MYRKVCIVLSVRPQVFKYEYLRYFFVLEENMEEYKLELKLVVDYPRCRMYRQFIQSLINNKNLRIGGESHLYYYTVLC